MKKKRLIYVFFINILFISFANAIENYKFHTLSPDGGFYYDGVKSVLPVPDGFVWILMDNNIQRFDGYEYKDYYSYFSSLKEDTKWFFNQISVDKNNNIHVSTNNGIYRYNRFNDSFEKIHSSHLSKYEFDNKDNIWFISSGLLLKEKTINNKVDTILYQGNPVRHIVNLVATDKYMFLYSQYNRIYRYDYETSSDSVSLYHLFSETYSIRDIKVTENRLWVLVNGKGIYMIDIESGRIGDFIDLSYFYTEELQVKAMHVDKNKNIWLATQRGLYIFDPLTRNSKRFLHSETDKFSITNSSVWSIAEDTQRNIWIGTFSGGLCYVNLEEKRWLKTYKPGDTGLNHNVVSCFAEDEHYTWIGTEGGGVTRMGKTNDRFVPVDYSGKNKNALPMSNVKSLVLDEQERLWIATFRGGLISYGIKDNRSRYYQRIARNSNSLKVNNLRKILLADDGGLWIAYQLNETVISYLSFENDQFTHFSLDENKQDKSEYVFDFCKDDSGNLWIITSKKLYRFNTTTFKSVDVSSSEIPYLNAQTLCLDSAQNIWIGTIGHGLIKYIPASGEFIRYKNLIKDGELSIYSISPGSEDCLWLGTNKGLYRYNTVDDTYMRFDENDGLQGNVFYPLAAMKSLSGELYLGGTNGFTVIDPRNISFNLYKPNVIISDFYINNESSLPILEGQTSGGHEKSIVLDHNQANFGFKFSSDSYLVPEKNQYKYRLRGYDDNWITTNGNARMVFYSKVPPGTYYFEILAANNDGIWNDKPSVIYIERLPSPWLSWKAYFIYTIILLSIIGVIFYYYNEKKKLKIQLYLDKLDKEKKEEIHQSQLRFFTNISHDFRTPLALILATLDNLKREGIRDFYYKILRNNAQRLLNLANELMDFRTVENGKMKLQVEPLDINELIRTLSFDFYDYADKHNILFTINSDNNLLSEILADRQIIEKIIMNLLNNAFKYTKDGGSITIESYADSETFISVYQDSFTVGNEVKLGNSFLIVVRDTGVGISSQSIKSVFERFYKVETANQDAHLGTGIGLALVKSLVILHKGSITIYSEREKGTDMVVAFPVNPDCYSESEYLKKEEYNEDQINHSPTIGVLEDNSLEELTDTRMQDVMLRERKRILVVEDNDDLRILLVNFLSQQYEVKEACNGMEATEILSQTEIDLILSDILMPVKNGITLCREVKADINTSHIPFILLTAKTGLESKLEGADSGADIYFEKPIDFNLLLLSIQNVFAHQYKVREYYAKNYFVDSAELSANEQDNAFLKKLIEIIDLNLTQPNIDVNYIASELSMSRSKLYSKLKTLTDKSIVEFILNYRMRKAAKLIIEQDMPMYQVMDEIGIKSQSYFIKVFKKEFGDTPTAFAAKNKKKNIHDNQVE